MAISSIIKSSLQQALQNVPQEIRHWFGSENVTYLIMDINQKLGLKGEDVRIIPKLLLRLEVHDLRPQYFIQELNSQLNISYDSAKILAIEIEEKILEPIKQSLLGWEVDINLIKVGHLIGKEEKEIRESEKLEAEERGDEIASPSARNDGKNEAEPISIPIEIRKPEPPIKIIGMEEEKKVERLETAAAELPTEGPMIIHEETELKPLSETKKSLKSLGGLFGFLKKKKEEEKPSPVKAEIEGTGFSKEIKKIIEEFKPIETKIKVVDYTEVPEKSPNNESARIYEYANKDNTEKNVANEIEPPIRIIDDRQQTIMEIKFPKIEAPESPPVASEVELLIIDDQQQTKKRFLSGLTKLFRRKKEDKKDIQPPEEPKMIFAEHSETEIMLESKQEITTQEIKKDAIASPLARNDDAETKTEPIIITQKTEQKPKKKFFSKLSGFFRKN